MVRRGCTSSNALDADELQQFEAHRAVCATCSREVAEFCEDGPEALRPRRRPASARGAARLHPVRPRRRAPRRRCTATCCQPRPRTQTSWPCVGPTRRARVRGARRRRVGGGARAGRHRLLPAPSAGPRRRARPRDASSLAAPDAQIVPLVLANGAQVSFVVSKSQNRALFVGGDLPSPGPGKTYELLDDARSHRDAGQPGRGRDQRLPVAAGLDPGTPPRWRCRSRTPAARRCPRRSRAPSRSEAAGRPGAHEGAGPDSPWLPAPQVPCPAAVPRLSRPAQTSASVVPVNLLKTPGSGEETTARMSTSGRVRKRPHEMCCVRPHDPVGSLLSGEG